ncbi:hypothetical protein ABZ565_16645 [Streptomyces sp. NPDC016469]|uniref:hypothetical protein n=1 Tax=Streptomyces sp. NPDC016469 TaxID=3157191 RepID=UPI0033E30FAA
MDTGRHLLRLLDAAQDTNPVLEEIFLAQQAQRVCVGDPLQQTYEWYHAKDIMSGFLGERMVLTQSLRFRPPIAKAAIDLQASAGPRTTTLPCSPSGAKSRRTPNRTPPPT